MILDERFLQEAWPAVSAGMVQTILITLISTGLATLLGLTVALGRKTGLSPLTWGLQTYVQFFRNTPLLIQLYLLYKGFPQVGLDWPPVVCGVAALSLQAGAYMAEIFRTGLESIPREQLEGGLSLGLSRWQTYRTILLPQALVVLLPPLGNQVVSLIKNSSLVAFITVPDLFFVVFSGGAAHFQYLEYFVIGIAGYMLLTLAASGGFHMLETCLPVSWRQAHRVSHA